MCLGIPGRIMKIYQKDTLRMAKIEYGGITKEACLEYTPEAELGDYVLIHVGFAISMMDAEEAQARLNLIKAVAGGGNEIP